MNREKINEARAKITKESTDIGGPLAIFIEEHVNQRCTSIDVAAKIMDKPLKPLIKLIEDQAKKNKSGNVGMVSDTDVIEMTDEYYELKTKKAAAPDVINVLDLI